MIFSKSQEVSSKTLCTFPPKNLLLCWLFSMGHWSSQAHGAVVGCPQTRGSFMASSPALVWHSPQVQVCISAPLQFSMCTGTIGFTTGLLGNLLWSLDHLLPHLLHHYRCLWGCFLNTVYLIPLSSSAVWHFNAFYKILSQTSHHLGWVCWSLWNCFWYRTAQASPHKGEPCSATLSGPEHCTW